VRTGITAFTAALVAVAVTTGGYWVTHRPSPEVVSAHADLAALALAPGDARGTARLLGGGGGTRLHLHITGMPAPAGYYEVWLIDSAANRMIAIGDLGATPDTVLPLPSTVDTHRYSLVDISAEEYDGNVGHSGRSMLRGSLTG
jgi:hypothetical protein